jgi:hypothetical protein
LGILALLFTAPAWATDPAVIIDALRSSALKGIESVYVMVAPPEADARCPDLTDEQVRTEVETRLHWAGIRIHPDAPSILLVKVVAVEVMKDILYGFTVSVELTEVVLLARDKRIMTLGATWHEVGLGVAGTSNIPEYPRLLLANIVDRFITIYLEQNPKK